MDKSWAGIRGDVVRQRIMERAEATAQFIISHRANVKEAAAHFGFKPQLVWSDIKRLPESRRRQVQDVLAKRTREALEQTIIAYSKARKGAGKR